MAVITEVNTRHRLNTVDTYARVGALLGPNFVNFGVYPMTVITNNPLTPAELIAIKKIVADMDKYDSEYESADKIQGLTPAQLDNWIDANVTDLASAKKALKVLGRSVLWLLQREIST